MKMDPRLVSLQKFEIQYIAKKFNIKPATVRAVIKKVGRSRRKVYAAIRRLTNWQLTGKAA